MFRLDKKNDFVSLPACLETKIPIPANRIKKKAIITQSKVDKTIIINVDKQI